MGARVGADRDQKYARVPFLSKKNAFVLDYLVGENSFAVFSVEFFGRTLYSELLNKVYKKFVIAHGVLNVRVGAGFL